LEKTPNECGFPNQEAYNGGGGPKSDEGLRPRCAEPIEQAHRWKGQLTGVLLRGETITRVEKGGGAVSAFSCRSGKKRGEEMGRGDVGGFRVSVSVGQEKK
jgi:hypothetical protein